MKQLRSHPAITMRFFPGFEDMGIRILPMRANRSFGGGESIYLASMSHAAHARYDPDMV
jgi:hypothetical protein